MYSLEDAKKNPEYWIEKLKNDLFLAAHSYMEENNINQTQLGEKLGVKRSRMSQILNGDYNPSMRKYIQFCLALEKEPIITMGDPIYENKQEDLQSNKCIMKSMSAYDDVVFPESQLKQA